MLIDPKTLDWKTSYRLLSSVTIPRPIGFISTIGSNGVANLAPYSYFCTVGDAPPMVMLAPSLRDGQKKDTARNIDESREFVVNMVVEDMLPAMVQAAEAFSPDISEFEKTGLTPLPCEVVKPPRVAESPINLECQLHTTFLEAKNQYTLYLGEIIRFHVADNYFDDEGTIDVTKIPLIGRLSGDHYIRLTDRIVMPRPFPSPI